MRKVEVYKQQQDDRATVKTAAVTRVVIRMNIGEMLEMRLSFAIKKTPGFSGKIRQSLGPSPQSFLDSEVVHAQCVRNKSTEHRWSKRV